jgi:hypothetical protein
MCNNEIPLKDVYPLGFSKTLPGMVYCEVYVAILGIRNASKTVE